MSDDFQHISVLLNETVDAVLPSDELLESLKNSATKKVITIVDATLGGAGHAEKLVKKFCTDKKYKGFDLHLIGIDQDTNAIAVATKKLNSLAKLYSNFTHDIFHTNFSELKQVISKVAKKQIYGLYADFGVSSPQLDHESRGFSFLQEGPLDMRMDQTRPLTAEKILLSYPEIELARIFYEYGEEPKSRILARAIIKDRQENKLPLSNTKVFADYIKRILKYGYSRTHPATRVFQALRIEVNNELDSIRSLLSLVPSLMPAGSQAAFISFHSLEDRLVKRSMRSWQEQGLGKESPRGGIIPTQEELTENKRARSARLRIFKFTG